MKQKSTAGEHYANGYTAARYDMLCVFVRAIAFLVHMRMHMCTIPIEDSSSFFELSDGKDKKDNGMKMCFRDTFACTIEPLQHFSRPD